MPMPITITPDDQVLGSLIYWNNTLGQLHLNMFKAEFIRTTNQLENAEGSISKEQTNYSESEKFSQCITF